MEDMKKTPPRTNPKDDVGWRLFPSFEALLRSQEPPALLAKVEKTCRHLNDLIHSGSQEDQQRAKHAMTAYGRSLDLLRSLTQLRDERAVATSASKLR